MYEAENLEIHTLQNELTQQLGVGASNPAGALQELVDARRAVGAGNGQYQNLRQRGLLTVEIAAEIDAAVQPAMSALRNRIAEIRAMGRMERAGLGMPKRVPNAGPPLPKCSPENVVSEIKALGGHMMLAPDGMGVQLIGCSIDQISADGQLALKIWREFFIQHAKRASGLA